MFPWFTDSAVPMVVNQAPMQSTHATTTQVTGIALNLTEHQEHESNLGEQRKDLFKPRPQAKQDREKEKQKIQKHNREEKVRWYRNQQTWLTNMETESPTASTAANYMYDNITGQYESPSTRNNDSTADTYLSYYDDDL